MTGAPTFTPGPWKLFSKNGVISVMKKGTTKEVVKWAGFDGTDFPRKAEANARLCAAGPEMYDALDQAEACMSIVEPRSDKNEYLRILGVVRAALAATQEK